ncbi:hypothetical protein N9U36_02180 [Candidatus Pelagibacter sp.]|nr:hypothetical protein [Candidatus Pelagibacter sp.]
MIVIATKLSHKLGYGHFFRSINIFKNFKTNNKILLLNNINKVKKHLKNVNYKIVNYSDKNWDVKVIKNKKVKIWINDRLKTELSHIKKLHKNSIFSVTLDDQSINAKKYNLRIAQNIQLPIKNKKVVKNFKYLALNKPKKNKKFLRKKLKNVMVSFGGTDTYNLTNKLIKKYDKIPLNLTVYVGPGYKHKIISNNKHIIIKKNVKNLENEMSKFDLIICGGGTTPFNAASQGLPSLLFACEKHEIKTAKYLEKLGISKYMGYRKIIIDKKDIKKLNLEKMSRKCFKYFRNVSIENLVRFIKNKYYENQRN